MMRNKSYRVVDVDCINSVLNDHDCVFGKTLQPGCPFVVGEVLILLQLMKK